MIVEESGMIADELCNQRDIPLCFNLAMFTQVDELNKERHLKASFTEFLEAIVRIIDKASLEPLPSPEDSVDSDEPKMSHQERKE